MSLVCPALPLACVSLPSTTKSDTAYCVGVAMTQHRDDDDDDQGYVATNRRIALYLAAVITVAWAASFIIDVLDSTYDPPASIHALMMIVAGSVFGEGLFQAAKKR